MRKIHTAKEGFSFLITFFLSTHTDVSEYRNEERLLQDPIAQPVIDELVRNEDLAFYVASVRLIVLSILLESDTLFNSPSMLPVIENTTSTFT